MDCTAGASPVQRLDIQTTPTPSLLKWYHRAADNLINESKSVSLWTPFGKESTMFSGVFSLLFSGLFGVLVQSLFGLFNTGATQ